MSNRDTPAECRKFGWAGPEDSTADAISLSTAPRDMGSQHEGSEEEESGDGEEEGDESEQTGDGEADNGSEDADEDSLEEKKQLVKVTRGLAKRLV